MHCLRRWIKPSYNFSITLEIPVCKGEINTEENTQFIQEQCDKLKSKVGMH